MTKSFVRITRAGDYGDESQAIRIEWNDDGVASSIDIKIKRLLVDDEPEWTQWMVSPLGFHEIEHLQRALDIVMDNKVAIATMIDGYVEVEDRG